MKYFFHRLLRSSPLVGWHSIAKAVVTVTVLGYLLTRVNWPNLWLQLASAEWAWIIAAIVIAGFSLLVVSIRWQVLLRVQGIGLSTATALSLTLIGQFFNTFLFGSVGGDAMKAVYVMRIAPSQKSRAMLSIVVDRGFGLLGFIVCGLSALPWEMRGLLQQEDGKTIAISLLVILVMSLLLIALLLVTPFSRFPGVAHRYWSKIPKRHIFQNMLSALRAYAKAKKLSGAAACLTIVSCLLVFLVGYSLSRAIHLDATYFQMILSISIVTVIVTLPISVGGHGLREGSFILLFLLLGVIPQEASDDAGYVLAVLFSMLFFVAYLFWGLIGGMIYASYKHSDSCKKVVA